MFRNDKKTRNAKKGSVDLSDVIKGMQSAVNEAQKMLELHNFNSLRNYFYEDGEPRTIELHLAEDNFLEVPILSLANHSSLMIDSLSMEFDAKIEQVELTDNEELLNSIAQSDEDDDKSDELKRFSASSAAFGVGFSGDPNSNSVKVKIEFRAAERTEGLSRVLDEFNKLVVPYKAIEGENNSTWRKHESEVGIKRGVKK